MSKYMDAQRAADYFIDIYDTNNPEEYFLPFRKIKNRMESNIKKNDSAELKNSQGIHFLFVQLILARETELSGVLLLSGVGSLVGAETELFSSSESDMVTVPAAITASLLLLSSIL